MDIKHLRLTALALLMGLLAVFTWANEPVCPAEHAVPLTQAAAASLLDEPSAQAATAAERHMLAHPAQGGATEPYRAGKQSCHRTNPPQPTHRRRQHTTWHSPSCFATRHLSSYPVTLHAGTHWRGFHIAQGLRLLHICPAPHSGVAAFYPFPTLTEDFICPYSPLRTHRAALRSTLV